MQNIISFYYNLNVEKLIEKDNSFYFSYDNSNYLFANYLYDDKDLKNVIEIIKFLENVNIKCHTIIENNNHEIITIFNNKKYILFKLVEPNSKLDFLTVIDFNFKTLVLNKKYANVWKELWIQKVDKIEDTLKNGHFDQIVNKTVDYYLGLAENAIEYVTNINEKYLETEYRMCVSHKRITNNYISFFNPLNMIFDNVVRDLSEYCKYLFFNNDDPMVDLKYLIGSNRLSPYEINLLYARLLFPTYYFDILENYFNKCSECSDLFNIVKKKEKYEKFLKKAYYELSQYAQLENIEWIKS